MLKVGKEKGRFFHLWHILSESQSPLCGDESTIAQITETDLEKLEGVSEKTKGKHQPCKACLAKHLGVEIEITKSGQLRRYGDTVLHATIVDLGEKLRTREEILALFNRLHSQRVYTKDDPERRKNPFLMTLNGLSNDGHKTWRLEASALYAD